VQVAKGNAAFSVGLMTLLMVVAGEMGGRVQPQGETEQTEAVGAGQPIFGFGNDLCHTPAEI
jgi:hypothetical protein